MATRTPKPKKLEVLQAAAMPLVQKGQNSLLYNAQVIDYLTNSIQSGQSELAWYYLAKIPELRYTCRYVANALSVATLYVGETDSSGNTPKRLPTNHPASELMEEFAGGYAGQSELLDRLGLHLTVIGDSVLIGPKTGTGGAEHPFDQWRVYSSNEVYSRNGQVYLRFPGNSREVPIPSSTMAVRIWRPHPRAWWDSDSPVKGSFSVLRELDGLDQHVQATIMSRLAGAGLMLLPDEIDLPNSDMETEGTEIDRFVALLSEVMGLAIKNRESASALIPIFLRGPAEYLDKIQHVDFATSFSDQVPTLRTAAIRRLALGMDVPPEILLGSESSTSWSSWQVDESTLRVHLVPMLQLIASSLTVGWLRPMLETLPLSESQIAQIPNLVVHFDISKLKIHQDISGDAQALFDRLAIDEDALRLSTGYGPDSTPDNKELAKQILFSLVRGGDPGLIAYALNGLRDNFGIDLLPKAPDPNSGGSGPGKPPSATPPMETTPISGPLPGKRSQAKQVSAPPVPKTDGDNSNNSVG